MGRSRFLITLLDMSPRRTSSRSQRLPKSTRQTSRYSSIRRQSGQRVEIYLYMLLKGPDPPPMPDRPTARRSSKYMSFAMSQATNRPSSIETQNPRLEFHGQIPSRRADLEQETAELRLEVSGFFRTPSPPYLIQHTEAEKESLACE